MAENLQNPQSSQVIAGIFQCSVRRVEQLTAEGVIKGQGRPRRYDLMPTIKAYIRYLSDKANGREKKQTDAELTTQKLEAESRFKKAKADMAELELKELRGELHRAADVEAITTDHVMFLRSLLMALPGALAVDMAAINNASEASNRIRQEVNSILERLSEFRYDPEEYKARVRERQGWDEQQRSDDEGKEESEDE